MDFMSFFLLLCKTEVKLLPLCTLVATLFPLLQKVVLQAIIFVALHEEKTLISQSLGVGAQLGLVAEGGPDRDHGKENGQTLKCPIGLLKNCV